MLPTTLSIAFPGGSLWFSTAAITAINAIAGNVVVHGFEAVVVDDVNLRSLNVVVHGNVLSFAVIRPVDDDLAVFEVDALPAS